MLNKNELKQIFNKSVVAARAMYPEETKNVTFAIMDAGVQNPVIIQWLRTQYPQMKDDLEALQKKYKMLEDHESSFIYHEQYTNKTLMCIKPNNSIFIQDAMKDIQFVFWHELGHIVDPKTYVASNSFFVTDQETSERSQAREVTADIFGCLHGLQQKFMDKENVKYLSAFRLAEAVSHLDLDHYTTEALDVLHVNITDKIISLTPEEIKTIAIKHAIAFPLQYQETMDKVTEIRKISGLEPRILK